MTDGGIIKTRIVIDKLKPPNAALLNPVVFTIKAELPTAVLLLPVDKRNA